MVPTSPERWAGRISVRAAATLLGAALCYLAVPVPAFADHHEMKQADVLPEAKRIEIFQALNAASARADRDADKQSAEDPESMNQVELADALAKKYRDEVLSKFGITALQAERIVAEGYQKSWRTDAASGQPKTSLD
jgi:hypothetical protein